MGGDASEEDMKKASQLEGQVMPIQGLERKRLRAMEVTDDLKNFKAFNAIRQSRAVARLWGIRAKKAKEAEADDLSKPKSLSGGKAERWWIITLGSLLFLLFCVVWWTDNFKRFFIFKGIAKTYFILCKY